MSSQINRGVKKLNKQVVANDRIPGPRRFENIVPIWAAMCYLTDH